jgi:soluble lytic murein transglycosylase
MSAGDWAAALPVLDRGLSAGVRDEAPPGRFAYFRARALLETGDTAAAREALAGVIGASPLSYYMLHAYTRLFDLDPARAREALEQAIAREPGGAFVIADDPAFHGPALRRAVELIRQGEIEYARREIGALLKDGASPSLTWAVALLSSRLGALSLSHNLPRTRLSDWLGHYPAGRWREPWEIAFPRAYSDFVEREAKKSGIPPALAYAIMREESAFDPDVVSPARAYGLMQLIVPTAKHVAKGLGISCDELSLAVPETNVTLGCKFLSDLRAKFPQNPHLAIPAYNAGPGAPQRWIDGRANDDFDLWVEQIPFDETRRYTKRVLTSYAAYAFLYQEDEAALRIPKVVATR